MRSETFRTTSEHVSAAFPLHSDSLFRPFIDKTFSLYLKAYCDVIVLAINHLTRAGPLRVRPIIPPLHLNALLSVASIIYIIQPDRIEFPRSEFCDNVISLDAPKNLGGYEFHQEETDSQVTRTVSAVDSEKKR